MNGELNGRDVISTRISGILKEAYWKLKMKRTHLMTWLDEFRTTLLHSSFHRFLHPTVTLQHPLILCFRATKKKKTFSLTLSFPFLSSLSFLGFSLFSHLYVSSFFFLIITPTVTDYSLFFFLWNAWFVIILKSFASLLLLLDRW